MIGTPKKAIVLRLLQERPELRFNQIGALAQCCGQYVGKLAKDTGYVKPTRLQKRSWFHVIPIEKDEDGRLRPVT